MLNAIHTLRQQKDALRFSAVLALLILVFLSPAILSNGYYAPGDNIRRTGAFLDGTQPDNYLLMDPLVQMIPWFKFSREAIHHGHLPLWNPYSGGGAPMLANPQATVLFPLSWLHFLFSFKIAFFLVAFLKLFLIGLWTYLYLRQIKMRPFVAGIGGVAFTFSGFNVVWLAWPLPGVTMALPCGLYFLERYFAQFQEDDSPSNPSSPNIRQLLPLVWFSAAMAWGMLAGHPQTFFHIAFVLALYAIYKACTLQAPVRRNARIAFGHLAKAGGAFMLGSALTAVMCVPFLEYLLSSYKFIARSEWVNSSYLPVNMAILNFIPDFFGNPALERERFVASNYNESTMSYVGLTMLFLALGGFIQQWKKPVSSITWFYAVLAIFCFTVIYHFPLVFDLVTKLPVFHQVHNQRLALELGFCLIVLGCSGLQQLMSADLPRFRIKDAGILAGGTFVLLLLLNGEALTNIQRWQWLVAGGFLLNVLALACALHWAITHRKFYALAALVLLETAGHGMIFNAVTKDKDFYPDNPLTTFLRQRYEQTGSKTLSVGFAMPPNLGTWYGFAMVREYDSIGMRPYEILRKSIDPLKGATETFGTELNLADLRFAGIRYIAAEKADAAILQKYHPELKVIYSHGNYRVLEHPVLPTAFLLRASSLVEAERQLGKLRRNWKAVSIEPVHSPYSWGRVAVEQDLYLDYTANTPSFLVLNQSYMPGWSGHIVGKKQDDNWCPAAAGIVKVLPIPAGSHRVYVAYKPRSLRWGMGIFGLAAIFWLTLLCLCFKAPYNDLTKVK